MKCEKCGADINENNRFCPSCGAKITPSKNTIQLQCKNCGGELTTSSDEPILSCPFCGSKELIVESDLVKIQRIKSKTQKEIEMKRFQHEEAVQQNKSEQEMRALADARLQNFNNSKLKKIIICSFIICLLIAFLNFRNGHVGRAIIASLQTIFFAAAWLFGMQIIKERIRSMHALVAAIGLLLVIPFFMVSGRGSPQKLNTYIWPENGINTVLPTPKSNKGEVSSHSSVFSADVYKTSSKEYSSYVKACQQEGFTIESEATDSSYHAYNDKGYYLSLSFFERQKKMSINLNSSNVFGSFNWPSSEIAGLIPQPLSTTGKVEREQPNGFLINVGDTPIDVFNEYIDECARSGFDIDSRRGEKYYYAYNPDGVYLSLEFKGFNTMRVEIEQQDVSEDVVGDEQIASTEEQFEGPELTTEPTPTPTPEATPDISLVDGMRPEFKAAIDSYESFFDEYCAFMKKYSDSNNDLSLMVDYTKFMSQYVDTMEKLDEMGNEEMNEVEESYYLKALTRINQKLIEAAQ